MNERIKNLSKKAWLLAHEANDQAEEDECEELTEAEFGNVFQQKFAESIIRECIDMVDKVYHEETDMGNKLGRRQTPYQEIVNAIEDHFGVES